MMQREEKLNVYTLVQQSAMWEWWRQTADVSTDNRNVYTLL
jgi:hypothetical protein